MLIENGADRSLVNKAGQTALDEAEEHYEDRLSQENEALRILLDEYKKIVDILKANNWALL